MKTITTIFLSFLETFAFCQRPGQIFYRNVIGLEMSASVSYKSIIGNVSIGDQFESHGYNFDSTMKFTESISSDVEYYKVVDSGAWTIKKGKLILRSSARKTEFDIIKVNEYYFFVLPDQRGDFIKEYKHLIDLYKGGASVNIGNKTDATHHLVTWQLSKMFYAKKVDNFTGT